MRTPEEKWPSSVKNKLQNEEKGGGTYRLKETWETNHSNSELDLYSNLSVDLVIEIIQEGSLNSTIFDEIEE
jgi:hypothetical protein